MIAIHFIAACSTEVPKFGKRSSSGAVDGGGKDHADGAMSPSTETESDAAFSTSDSFDDSQSLSTGQEDTSASGEESVTESNSVTTEEQASTSGGDSGVETSPENTRDDSESADAHTPEPALCGDGSFSATGEAPCKAWTKCNSGQHVGVSGSATDDRVCVACDLGTFSEEANADACVACRSCYWLGEEVSCTRRQDTVCRAQDVTRQFGSTADDVATAATMDSEGNLWVVGFTDGALDGPIIGGRDAFVRKYSADGNSDVVQQFGTTSDDAAFGVGVDAEGNIWVAGYTDGVLGTSSETGRDAFVRVIPADGSAPRTDQFGTESSDWVNGLVIDANGDVWVVGVTGGKLGAENFGGNDGFLRRYPASGEPATTQQFGSSANDEAIAVAVDDADHVWLGGNTYGKMAGANVGERDCFVQRYDTKGGEPRTYQFGSTLDDGVSALAIDGSGALWVTGSTQGSMLSDPPSFGAGDGFVRHYPAEGVPVTVQFGTDGEDAATAMAVDGSNNVWVGGTVVTTAGDQFAVLRKFAPEPPAPKVFEFAMTPGDQVVAAVSTSFGDIWLVGATLGELDGTNQGGQDAFVRQMAVPEE